MKPLFRFRPSSVLSLVLLAAVFADGAFAQPTTRLDPPQERYTLGQFEFRPPTGDGWRQIAGDPNRLTLVFVEELPDSRINSRAQITISAVAVGEADRALAPDADALVALVYKRNVEGRGDMLMSQTPVTVVPGDAGIRTFRLSTQYVDHATPIQEVFWIAAAATRDQYLVVQLSTLDADVDAQRYYLEIYGSLASIAPLGGSADGAAGAQGDSPSAP